MFRFYLNNIIVNDPSNWKDFEEVLEYDIENNSYLFTYSIDLNFNGGLAYNYLLNQYELNSCNYVEIKIEKNICGDWSVIFIGNIFLSDLKINRNLCNIKAPVQESGFTSFLNNNKQIKVQIRELPTANPYNLSKNGVSMNSMTIDAAFVDLFDTTSGNYQNAPATLSYYIYDCFKYIVGYLSDMQMDFESNFLNRNLAFTTPKTNVKRLVLTNGNNIYWGAQNTSGGYDPFVTLQELLEEVNNYYPIGFYVRYDFNGRATFVLEDLDYFLNGQISVTFDTIKSVEEKRATEAYYSNITIGGNTVQFDATLHTYEPIEKYTFSEENYYFGGTCNIDKTKNLNGKFFVDTNIVQELMSSTSSIRDSAYNSYGKNNFFIEVNNTPSPGIERALKTVNTNNSFYHYNENLQNIKVIERFENFGDIYYSGTNNPHDLITSSPRAYLKKYSFDKAISDSDYKTIKNNLLNKIEINIDNNGTMNSGWIKRIARKFESGESQIELRAE